MNKKGFTLIELVTVIALLGIIAIIAFVSIFQVINKSKVSDCENLILSIKSAAKEYASDNRYNLIVSGSFEYIDGKKIEEISGRTQKYIEIKASDLVSGEYLSSSIFNPFDNSDKIEPSDIEIRIHLSDDYTVGYVPVNSLDSTEDIVVKSKKTDGSFDIVDCDSNEW